MNRHRTLLSGLLSLSLSLSAACSGSGDVGAAPSYGSSSGTGLAPGGAQDFGRFKAILDAGMLPGPETLDQVGFFAEHRIGDPPTRCSDPVCAQAQFGAMNNMINGSTCTLMHLALGTPLDPTTQPRPPIDIAIVVDQSSRDLVTGLADLRAGIGRLLDGIADADTVTVIAQGRDVRVLSAKVPGNLRDSVRAALSGLRVDAPGEPYDGLRRAVDTLGAPVSGRHRRVVYVSGAESRGQIGPERTARLIRGFAQGSGGVTVLALGELGNVRALQDLADAGAGALYYVGRTADLPALFDREVSYSLIPIAEKVVIRLAPGRSYRLREVFGVSTASWTLAADGGQIDIPALFSAWRTTTGSPLDRRGGGGAILVEVLPRTDAPRERPAIVGDVTVEYNVPGGPRKSVALQVVAPDGPYDTPPAGRFSTASVEKGFVVLNLYVALRMASQRSAVGDLRGAYDVLTSVQGHVRDWLDSHPDVEIQDDLRYVERFSDLLAQRGADQQPPRAPGYRDPWPRD